MKRITGCYTTIRNPLGSERQIFKIGSGPSSSHTMGPKLAAETVIKKYPTGFHFKVHLFGSLAQTGAGHKTDYAIQQVLTKENSEIIWHKTEQMPQHTNGLCFDIYNSSNVLQERMPFYSVGGGIIMSAPASDMDKIKKNGENQQKDENKTPDSQKSVASPSQTQQALSALPSVPTTPKRPDQPLPPKTPFIDFKFYKDYSNYCLKHQLSLPSMVYELENRTVLEAMHLPKDQILRYCRGEFTSRQDLQDVLIQCHLLKCWKVMQSCIEDGLNRDDDIVANISTGGSLTVKRLAKKYYIKAQNCHNGDMQQRFLLTAYALAVSENNGAATHDVVTAPTCGACGVLPAVLYYYYMHRFPPYQYSQLVRERCIVDALSVAGVIANICFARASISGAQAGCQAEIGVACAMAASACVILEYYRNPKFSKGLKSSELLQAIEQAAKNALQQSIGLTCDPVGGLVLIPCVQRNALYACKAYDAALMATSGLIDENISFDEVVQIMGKTGEDMSESYKETAEAGHAMFYRNDEESGFVQIYSEIDNTREAKDDWTIKQDKM